MAKTLVVTDTRTGEVATRELANHELELPGYLDFVLCGYESLPHLKVEVHDAQ